MPNALCRHLAQNVNMSIATGQYEFTHSENIAEFYRALGASEEVATKTAIFVPCTLNVAVDGDNVTMTTTEKDKITETKFVVGKAFSENMAGTELESVGTIEGNKIVINSCKESAPIGGRTYEFTGSEVIVSITAPGTPIVYKRFYKK